jgi:hypothetical protein
MIQVKLVQPARFRHNFQFGIVMARKGYYSGGAHREIITPIMAFSVWR